MSAFRRIDLGLTHNICVWDYFSFNNEARWEVLERRRENFYAYDWSLVELGESKETALEYRYE